MPTPLTFTRARAANRNLLSLAAVPDELEPYAPFTRQLRYQHDLPDRWYYTDFPFCVQGICIFREPGRGYRVFSILSAEGDVVHLDANGLRQEKIDGAGLSVPGSIRHGRLQRIQQVGDHLYACGDGAQTYRRADDGRWAPLDLARFQDPLSGDISIFHDVNGPSEREIYVVGSGGTVLFWDGASFTPVPVNTRSTLVNILVEADGNVWICGRDGTLLCGNHRDGFRQRVRHRGRHVLVSLTRYAGTIYLASQANPRGLLTFDGAAFQPVTTGLDPEVDDVHTVDAADGVLWAVGQKDLLRLDGTAWSRIGHPDNAPLGRP